MEMDQVLDDREYRKAATLIARPPNARVKQSVCSSNTVTGVYSIGEAPTNPDGLTGGLEGSKRSRPILPVVMAILLVDITTESLLSTCECVSVCRSEFGSSKRMHIMTFYGLISTKER